MRMFASLGFVLFWVFGVRGGVLKLGFPVSTLSWPSCKQSRQGCAMLPSEAWRLWGVESRLVKNRVSGIPAAWLYEPQAILGAINFNADTLELQSPKRWVYPP